MVTPFAPDVLAGAHIAVLLRLTPEGLVYEWRSVDAVPNPLGDELTPVVLDAGEIVAMLRKAAGGIAAEAGLDVCRVCGCSDLSACSPPCSWANPEHDLCSSHDDTPPPLGPGWGFPFGVRTCHYFSDGSVASLCERAYREPGQPLDRIQMGPVDQECIGCRMLCDQLGGES